MSLHKEKDKEKSPIFVGYAARLTRRGGERSGDDLTNCCSDDLASVTKSPIFAELLAAQRVLWRAIDSGRVPAYCSAPLVTRAAWECRECLSYALVARFASPTSKLESEMRGSLRPIRSSSARCDAVARRVERRRGLGTFSSGLRALAYMSPAVGPVAGSREFLRRNHHGAAFNSYDPGPRRPAKHEESRHEEVRSRISHRSHRAVGS